MKQNPFHVSDRVVVYGYESTGFFINGYHGNVIDIHGEILRVKVEVGDMYITVHWRQCRKVKPKK